MHDTLLPAYAGFAPLNWALINGEPEVGVTAHMMNGDSPTRLRVLSAGVSDQPYGGTPGRIFIRDGAGGVVVVAGADARRRVRTDDGRDHTATEYFTRMGGYLTSHPTA